MRHKHSQQNQRPPTIQSHRKQMQSRQRRSLTTIREHKSQLRRPHSRGDRRSRIQHSSSTPQQRRTLRKHNVITIKTIQQRRPSPRQRNRQGYTLPQQRQHLRRLNVTTLHQHLQGLPSKQQLTTFRHIQYSHQTMSQHNNNLQHLHHRTSIQVTTKQYHINTPTSQPRMPTRTRTVQEPTKGHITTATNQPNPYTHNLISHDDPHQVNTIHRQRNHNNTRLSQVPVPQQRQVLT